MTSPLSLSNFSSLTGKKSGLDVYDMVSKTMQSRNTLAPKLNAALTSDKTRLSGLGQLQSALASFQSLASTLAGKGLSTSAKSSDTGVLTATASGNATAGSYTIKVDQLAQSQVLTAKPQSSATTNIGNGAPITIKLDLGTTGDKSFTAASSKSITVSGNNTSLQGIATAINAANMGVTASVTQTADGYVLSLKSPSGAANSMRLDVSGDPAVAALLNFNPAGGKNMTQTQAAQNALLAINGTSRSSASNTVTDAVPGAVLKLSGTGSSTVTIAQDSSQIASNITNLVNAYNQLSSKLQTLQKGELQADGLAGRIQGQLDRIFNGATASGKDGNTLTLSRLGITRAKTSELTINADTLQKAVTADPAGAAALFSGKDKGLVSQIGSQIDGLLGSSGTVQKQTKALNADIANINNKRDQLQKAMTLQAQALAQKYSQLSNGSSSSGTLFDTM
ncbi:flagellar hook-associated protein 2 [Andreprevotia lacus DSM 23236]|uniref:Flagellar hook-associated protein 2 n=1 Tax=Andreprevotia lacus DSM 23236 TaxID=1121001 RepID=A0A1W1XY82_9NEIS|nr:flagellar filament capping protein FliD [Andreprevotia lacus]SMC28511.1 flagellar hook-associated protein 2 [Andreprevotia lacus DSM 23236]